MDTKHLVLNTFVEAPPLPAPNRLGSDSFNNLFWVGFTDTNVL